MEFLENFYYFFAYWFLAMIFSVIVNLAIINTILWGALTICRIFSIPWLDGTTKGFYYRD